MDMPIVSRSESANPHLPKEQGKMFNIARFTGAALTATAAAALTFGGTLITSSSTSAAVDTAQGKSSIAAPAPCGYLGAGKYRHCDGGSKSTVMLDVKTIIF
ncbi:hypothetical protein ABZ863_22480 [Saccharomonospora sp. NPDC046836]|uniref:hypothetical protein n=1 Tax=Saccharomonospora sp. NPDC046836 TaxID=3156921 RepID=UPI0033DB5812